MNRQDSVGETSVDNPVRPSLYANTLRERSAKATEVFSILESLEPSRKRRGRGILLALGGFSLLAATVFVTHRDAGYLAGAEAWMAARLGRPAEAPAAVQEQIASVPQARGEDPAAAGIVTEAAEETFPLQDASAEDEVAVVLPRIEDSPPLAAVAPAGTSAAAGEGHKGSTGEKPATGSKSKAAAKPHPKKHAGKPARTPHRSTASKPGAKDKDKDVVLIAALLSHVSASGSQVPKKKAGSTPAAKSARALPAAKSEVVPPTNRDVIVRTADESTDALVKRCQALGLLEGQLCRMRICSGLWGKDPACPAGGNAPSDGQ